MGDDKLGCQTELWVVQKGIDQGRQRSGPRFLPQTVFPLAPEFAPQLHSHGHPLAMRIYHEVAPRLTFSTLAACVKASFCSQWKTTVLPVEVLSQPHQCLPQRFRPFQHLDWTKEKTMPSIA